MNIVLFDGEVRDLLLPFAFTRPVAEFRFGILTMKEKWERMLPGKYSYLTQKYLSKKYPSHITDDNFFIAANVCPSLMLSAQIELLKTGEALISGSRLVAFRGSMEMLAERSFSSIIETEQQPLCFDYVYDLFMRNDKAIEEDFKLITDGRQSEALSPTVQVIGDPYFEDGTPKIFIEKGASLECVVLNVSKGPVYIGEGAEIQEGSCIRAPFAACEHSVVNMITKVYGPTTLGPYCKVGGELNNVIMFGYSNKAHQGFLGNAVIGEWCNLGAGTDASNLKNNYAEIKIYSYKKRGFVKSGLQFCGLMMGDHSKAGINTMFNTATVVGVGCNVYGANYPRTYIQSFSEGGAAGLKNISLSRFYDGAQAMMTRRHKELTDTDKAIYEHLYNEEMSQA